MAAVAATVVLKGDGEEEGEERAATELKQASRELSARLLSTGAKWKRSRPGDAAALELPSEVAKGSSGE